jgi:hypothetical protein
VCLASRRLKEEFRLRDLVDLVELILVMDLSQGLDMAEVVTPSRRAASAIGRPTSSTNAHAIRKMPVKGPIVYEAFDDGWPGYEEPVLQIQ